MITKSGEGSEMKRFMGHANKVRDSRKWVIILQEGGLQNRGNKTDGNDRLVEMLRIGNGIQPPINTRADKDTFLECIY